MHRRVSWFLAVLFSAGLFLGDPSPSLGGFILAGAVAPPGNNPDHNGPVILYELEGTGALVPLPTIPGRPQTLLNDPSTVVFNSRGELFVGNRQGSQAATSGSIARFLIDEQGNYIANGAITDNGLLGVHGLAFSSQGELFAANIKSQTISRFVFDAAGNAVANGTVSLGPVTAALGLAFSASNELFVTTYTDVRRYRFDPVTGDAIFNGSFAVPGSTFLHHLEFSPTGELFIAGLDTGQVYRYRFDADGNPLANGALSVPGGVGLAFSPAGELFVGSHGAGGITRFTFDAAGNATFNGFTATDSLGDLAIYDRSAALVPAPGSFVLLALGALGLLLCRVWPYLTCLQLGTVLNTGSARR